MLSQLFEEFELGVQILDDHLDDEVAIGKRVQVGRAAEAGERFLFLGLIHLAALHRAAQVPANAGETRFQERQRFTSTPVTASPAVMQTCAMPEPMAPRPTTPTFFTASAMGCPRERSRACAASSSGSATPNTPADL